MAEPIPGCDQRELPEAGLRQDDVVGSVPRGQGCRLCCHDSHIGVGRVIHLFRLPEAVEQSLLTHLLEVGIPEDVGQALTSRDAAMARLRGFVKSPVELHGGPLKVGTTEDLHGHAWLSRVAAVYHAAFEEADAPAFPYLVEGR